MTAGLIILGYLASSFAAWGLTLGYFDHEFPANDNVGVARVIAIAGPVGLLLVVMFFGILHWRSSANAPGACAPSRATSPTPGC